MKLTPKHFHSHGFRNASNFWVDGFLVFKLSFSRSMLPTVKTKIAYPRTTSIALQAQTKYLAQTWAEGLENSSAKILQESKKLKWN